MRKIKFLKSKLKNVYIIKGLPFKDKRGEFKRIYCKEELGFLGLKNIVQINYSKNKKKYTFRGLHYQTGRSAEDKLVVCVRGKIQDIFVNIQKDSKEYLKSSSEILDCKENKVLLVPRGFAHGFLTLKENTEVIYFSTNFYDPRKEKGIRWNDPRIKLVLKSKPRIISEKDKNINFLDS